jgi:hypothetical protein
MGNVSYLVPSIHPMIRIAPKGVALIIIAIPRPGPPLTRACAR